MSLLDIKDRIPTNVLSNEAVRYGVYDEEGKLLRYEYMKREDEPIEEGTPINKVLFNTLSENIIGYNILQEMQYEEEETATGGLRRENVTKFYDGTASHNSTCVLKNGNVLIAFGEGSASASFVIYDENFQLLKSKTTFNPVRTESIATLPLENGNVLIAFRDGTNNTFSGCYVVYDEEGNLVKEKTVFRTERTNNIRLKQFPNGNVLFVYIDDGMVAEDRHGEFAIYNEDFELVGEKVILNVGATYSPSCELLDNGNIFIAFQDASVSPAHGVFMIYNQERNIVKDKTEFTPNVPSYIAVIKNKLGNVFIGYTDGSDNNYGKMVIYDEDGELVKGTTVFNSYQTLYLNGVAKDNGAVFIWYDGTSGRSLPAFICINENGGVSQSLTQFSPYTAYTIYISSATLKNGDIIISYVVNYTASTYMGQFSILSSSSTYKRNYILDKIGKPQKGERLSLWKDSDFAKGEVMFSNNKAISFNSVVELENADIFISYADATDNVGKFTIYDGKGKKIINPVQFSTSSITFNYSLLLPNGNIFLVYRSNYGYFVIISPEGNIIKNVTTFAGKSIVYLNATVLPNENVFIAYSDSSNKSYGKFVIYDQNGNLVKSETQFYASAVSCVSVNLLKNGEVLVSFLSDSTIAFKFFDQLGNEITTKTATTIAYSTDFKVQVLKNGNFVVVKRDNSTFGGYFYIYDSEGKVVKSNTNFATRIDSFSVSILENGNFVIAYSDDSNGGHKAYIVCSEYGNIIKNGTHFGSEKFADYISALGLKDGKFLIAYDDTNTSSYGKFEMFEKDLGISLSSNTLNGEIIDTIFQIDKFYELVYDGEKYIAKEVRV